MPYLVRALSRQSMLPAILFIFSRAGCDEAAKQVAEQVKAPTLPCPLLTVSPL